MAALPLALVAAVGALAALAGSPALAEASPDEQVWITIAEDAFAAATDVFSGVPGLAGLPRVAQANGVVLTIVTESDMAALSVSLHEKLLRCGGFVAHANLEEGLEALSRVGEPRASLGAVPFAIDQAARVATVDAELAASNILATITSLSAFPNRFHSWAATHGSHLWIRDLWAGYAANRSDISVELFSHSSWSPSSPQPSVVVTIPGSVRQDEIIVLGAHQDSTASGCSSSSSCNAPGADDDASGVATISEVLRAALETGFTPHRTVKFMAYAAEEVGLRGSSHLAATHLSAGANVVGVLQLDMTGYAGSVNDIYLITDYTDPDLTAFLQSLASTYLPEYTIGTTTCGYGCSDHKSWFDRGYRSAFPFEAKFLPGPPQYNPTIHSTSDTVATLGNSAAHALKFARLASAFLVETAFDGVPEIFLDGFESEDTAAWSSTVP